MAESNVPPSSVMVAMDTACFVLGTVPGVVAWSATFFYERAMWQRFDASALFVVASFAAPVVALATFLFVVFALRILMPRVREGVYPLGLNLGIVAWYCQLALARAASISGLSPLIRAMHVTRFLYFRALGADFALRVNTSHDFLVMDAPLLTVRRGATLSLHSTICCHTFSGKKLALLPVEIGENVFIGGNAFIGPHTRIGDGSWIGMGNVVYGEELPPNTRIENFAQPHGKKES